MIREWREDELQISESFRQLANMLEEHEANMVHTEITEEEEIAIKFAIKQSVVNQLVLTVNAKIVCSQHDLTEKTNYVTILESQDSKTSKNGIGLLSDIDTQLSHPFSGCKGRTDHVCKPDLMGWFDYDTTNKVGYFLGGDVMYGLTDESYMICKSGQGYLYASSSGQRALSTEDGIFEDIKVNKVVPMIIEFIRMSEENGILRENAAILNNEEYYTIGYGTYLIPGRTIKFSDNKIVTLPSGDNWGEYVKVVQSMHVDEEQALYAINYMLEVDFIPLVHALVEKHQFSLRQCEFDGLALLAYNTPAAFDLDENPNFHKALENYLFGNRPQSGEIMFNLLEEFGSYRENPKKEKVVGIWKRSVQCGLIFIGNDYTIYNISTPDGIFDYIKEKYKYEMLTHNMDYVIPYDD